MPRKQMQIVREPDRTRSGIIGRRAPIMVGEGDTDYVCGICDTMLLASVRCDEVQGLIAKCPNCGTFNEIDLARHIH